MKYFGAFDFDVFNFGAFTGVLAVRVARDGVLLAALDYDPFRLNRIMVFSFAWGVIPSENRHPLFRIMP